MTFDATMIDFIMEDELVKNKETGNVYSVKNVNPDKHTKPTAAEKAEAEDSKGETEEEKPESDQQDGEDVLNGELQKEVKLQGIDLGDFGKLSSGKKVAKGLDNFINKGVVTSAQKRTLEKYIRYRTKGNGQIEYAVFNDDGKQVAVLPPKAFARLESSISNTSTEYMKYFNKALKKRGAANQGHAAEDAAVALLKRFRNKPEELPENWRKGLKAYGLNPSEPFKVKAQEASVTGKGLFDDKERKIKSKADIIIEQNGKTYPISVKYTGGKPATIGRWKVENIEKYFGDTDDEGAKGFIDAIKNLREKKGSKAENEAVAGSFLRTPLGKKFLLDIMTKITQTSELPPEAQAQYMMIIDQHGGVTNYKAKDYLDLIQSLGLGTGGCGFQFDWSSAQIGKQFQTRGVETKSQLLFKEVK